MENIWNGRLNDKLEPTDYSSKILDMFYMFSFSSKLQCFLNTKLTWYSNRLVYNILGSLSNVFFSFQLESNLLCCFGFDFLLLEGETGVEIWRWWSRTGYREGRSTWRRILKILHSKVKCGRTLIKEKS